MSTTRDQSVERIAFRLNGSPAEITVAPWRTLVDVLRDDFGLTGVRVSCDQAVCGACTVLVDGQPTASCATLAYRVGGREVETIEGLRGEGGELHPIQQAFIDRFGFQCGFCTPGMVMATKALLEEQPDADRSAAQRWLASNICRCTGYEMILDAVECAAQRMQEVGRDD